MSKKTSGIIGMIVGGLWLLNNIQYYSQQGFVAIGMPIIIFTAGLIYYRNGDT